MKGGEALDRYLAQFPRYMAKLAEEKERMHLSQHGNLTYFKPAWQPSPELVAAAKAEGWNYVAPQVPTPTAPLMYKAEEAEKSTAPKKKTDPVSRY